MTYKTLYLSDKDSVAVAMDEIPAGAMVTVTGDHQSFQVTLVEPIRFGHKFAVKPIQAGDDIIKYGEVIGAAVTAIEPGAHVHVHNLEGKRGRGDKVV